MQLPVHVHNDANAATIAEWQLGAGRGTRNFCYVTVSTGMGCGIISNGQLVTGRAYAGELGRTRIASTDGSTAQLEQISSGTAIAARALIAAGTPTSLATIDPTNITAGTVAAAAAAGDHVARSIFTTAATTLGIQLANLTRLIDPETIALGGGVTLAGDIFWDPLRATIEESLAQDSIPLPRLVEAELHSDAGLPRRGNSTPQSLISRGWPSPAPRCTARNLRRSQSSMRTTPWSRYGHSPGPASS